MIRSRLAILIAVVAALGSFGCSRRVPSATVVLVDPSASVTERARRDEFAVVATLIPRMQRGDLLTIIPITDNAAADTEGRVQRFHAPERREAYDADLRHFQADAGKQYGAFASDLLAHPGQRTDILGALDVARQEFEDIPPTDDRTLVVLSDFLEDDGTYRFDTDRRLTCAEGAKDLARYLRNVHKFMLHNAKLRLGALQSDDFAQVPPKRQIAVRVFWNEYLSSTSLNSRAYIDGITTLTSPVITKVINKMT